MRDLETVFLVVVVMWLSKQPLSRTQKNYVSKWYVMIFLTSVIHVWKLTNTFQQVSHDFGNRKVSQKKIYRKLRFASKNRNFLTQILSKLKIHFFRIILQIAKNRSKQATTIIFFQRKLRVHTLQIWKMGAKRGAKRKPILVWKYK